LETERKGGQGRERVVLKKLGGETSTLNVERRRREGDKRGKKGGCHAPVGKPRTGVKMGTF